MTPRKDWTIAESYHSLIHRTRPPDVLITHANLDDPNVPRDPEKQVRRTRKNKDVE